MDHMTWRRGEGNQIPTAVTAFSSVNEFESGPSYTQAWQLASIVADQGHGMMASNLNFGFWCFELGPWFVKGVTAEWVTSPDSSVDQHVPHSYSSSGVNIYIYISYYPTSKKKLIINCLTFSLPSVPAYRLWAMSVRRHIRASLFVCIYIRGFWIYSQSAIPGNPKS